MRLLKCTFSTLTKEVKKNNDTAASENESFQDAKFKKSLRLLDNLSFQGTKLKFFPSETFRHVNLGPKTCAEEERTRKPRTSSKLDQCEHLSP